MNTIKPNQSLNFPGIEDRVELEYKKETTHDDYTDDTLGDPEGAEARAAARSERLEFPEWVFGNFKLSPVTYYGKPWPDKQQHLIPRELTIDEIMAVHDIGMTDRFVTGCFNLAAMMPNFEEMKQKYLELLDVVSQPMQFDVMNGLQNSVERSLARRAVARFRYNEAADRANTKDDYLEGLFSRMESEAMQAGANMLIHRACWRSLQWKNEPKYTRVRNAIVLEQINAAKYVEEKFGSKDTVSRAKISQYGDEIAF